MTSRIAVRRALPAMAIVALGLALRFWHLGELPLLGDESYYWLWSRHLDWAFFDHPAGVAVLVWLSTALGGQAEAGIRWLNALLGAACVPMTYLVGARMFSRRAGLLAGLAVAVGAPYLLTSRFVYTDSLQLLLMLLNVYGLWLLITEAPSPKLSTTLLFGLSLAALVNTKYTAYLYVLGLTANLLLDHRRLLRVSRFWIGLLIGALGLVPVVAWNASRDWMSFRWQLSHLGLNVAGDPGFLGRLAHTLGYLTWPLVVLGVVGLISARRKWERLLVLMGLVLLLPFLVSPVSSPRNLSNGWVFLLLLAGARWSGIRDPRQRLINGLIAVMVISTAVYGVGTTLALYDSSLFPRTTAVPDIRRDAIGWREMGPELATYPEPVFALDYSIASQIWYYSGRPAHTAWGQYRIWGLPDLDSATVVSLDYLPHDAISVKLQDAFGHVDGPRQLIYQERGSVKEAWVWQASGLRIAQDVFLERFDFLTLLEASR